MGVHVGVIVRMARALRPPLFASRGFTRVQLRRRSAPKMALALLVAFMGDRVAQGPISLKSTARERHHADALGVSVACVTKRLHP